MPEGALAAIMVGVFRQGGLFDRQRRASTQPRLLITALTGVLFVTACGASSDPPTSEVPVGEVIPTSLDGLWILENSDLNLDIDIATAEVDGRTSCARLLGSLTFLDDGATTSFSLPGRDDRSCSTTEVAQVDKLQELLESIASAQPEAGGYELLDSDGDVVGRLRVGA